MIKRRPARRKLLTFAIIALCTFFSGWGLPGAFVYADTSPSITIKTTVGFNGEYKWNSLVPLSVTVTNQGASGVEGNIQLDLNGQGPFGGIYSQHLSLAKGETKTVHFTIFGQLLDGKQAAGYVEWVDNNHTPVKQPLIATGMSEGTTMVGILSDDATFARLLQSQPPEKNQPFPLHLTALHPNDIPADSLITSQLDVLLVSVNQEAKLSPAQKLTIRNWTADGGLYLSVDGKSNSQIWDAVSKKERDPSVANAKGRSLGQYQQLGDIAAQIPALRLPNIPNAALFFLCYILVVGPLTYYVMKKRNRREWNWLVIPLVSLIVSYGIYGYGKWKHGDSVILQNISVVDIKNGGRADVLGGTAFFAPHGGDYQLRFTGSPNVFPIRNNPYREDTYDSLATVSTGPGQTNIQFNNTAFWSLQKSFVYRHLQDAGQFKTSLVEQNQRLTGTVQNQTAYTLHDVKIVCGQSVQSIPKLDPGSVVQVNLPIQPFQPTDQAFTRTPFARSLLPENAAEKKEAGPSREEKLLEMLFNNGTNLEANKLPIYLLGWTDQQPFKNKIMNQPYTTFQLTLVKASLGYTEGTVDTK
ncbi:hypothetical protein [Aneurinibacillus terranovensis]|uniref:hypothetical protein n=1 Tax=Aneurinibacillus terranovensis TaxID=278991 RepID=UPI0004209B21|nr:hypothetical protein [Aneurinibacillus terranovensis]